MLIGEHSHTMDEKRRMSLPAKFRIALGKSIVITRGLDNCLFVYSTAQWEKVVSKLTELSYGSADSRAFVRFSMGGAVEVSVDKSGRILIPDFLAEFAGLENEVILAGLGNRVEIWNAKSWHKYSLLMEKNANVLAEHLGEVGMI